MTSRLLHRAVFYIGGEPLLTVHADSHTALRAPGLIPGPCPAPGETAPGMELYLLGNEALDARCDPPPEAEFLLRTETVEVRVSGALHYGNWFGKAASVFDRGRGAAVILIPGLRRYHPDFVARSICRPVLDRMLWERGYFTFHAAVAAWRGRGCLIAGPSGSGKSTLLRGLLGLGFEFLSDDRAVITDCRGRAEVLHFPEPLRIAVSRGRKRALWPPEPVESRVPPRGIVFLERTGGSLRLSTPGRAEAAARLVQAWSPYLGISEREAALDAAESVVRTAEFRVVRGWGGARERLALVRAFLEE